MKNIAILALSFLTVFSTLAREERDLLRLPVSEVSEKMDFQTRTYPGLVVAVAQVNIVSRVNGEILKVGFQNGDVVKAGQMLYQLDSVKYEAAVKNAEAKVAEYKARTAYAESNYTRNKQLLESNAVSRDTLENALSERNAYQASLAAAEADLVSAKDDLAHCRIGAPISGKVGSTNFTFGNYVTNNSGTLVTLIQTSPIRVRFSISSTDFLNMFGGRSHVIRKDGHVRLTLANGRDFPEDGVIEYVDNASDSETDTIQVFAVFPNKERILKPGGIVSVVLKNRVGVPCVSVPPSAVMQDVKGAFVWVVGQDGRVSKRYIVRGGVSGDGQLLKSGVEKGEKIVVDGTHRVFAGDRIVPVKGM